MHFKKDLTVVIPVYAIHHNPDNWEDPEKFDPDRYVCAVYNTLHAVVHVGVHVKVLGSF